LPVMSAPPKKRANAEEESGWSAILAKALRPGADWPDKDDLLDVLYWGRQVFALVLGVIFGVIPLSGVLSIVAYVAVSTLAGQYFVVNYQGADEEQMGGFWELAKEGFGTAFATFLVSWITTYSAIHHD
ncbi:hypothetical protein PENTCL1PPCAC_2867, partial [Pristionchus entomophagus]